MKNKLNTLPETLKDKLLLWFATGETGLSSKSMAKAVMGVKNDEIYPPYDVGDFTRCAKLVKAIPEILDHRDTIAKLSPEWNAIMGSWDQIHASLVAERGDDFSIKRPAPETAALLDIAQKKAS